MARALVVTQSFGRYAVGDRITDQSVIDALLHEHAPRVVVISVDDPAVPAPPAPPKA